MMIMNQQTASPGAKGGKENSSASAKPMALRRRRSKGTIAGYQNGPSSAGPALAGTSDSISSADVTSVGGDGTSSSNVDSASGSKPQHVMSDSAHASAGSLGASSSGQSPSTSGIKPPPRPCHAARMALLCVQNAIYMGARTQLALCPPGRARRKLAGKLRERRDRDGGPSRMGVAAAGGAVNASLARGRLGRVASVSSSTSASASITARMLAEDGLNIERILGEEGMREYDRSEDECIGNPEYYNREVNSDGEELIEDPSSGDDDDLDVDGDDGRIPRSNDPVSSRYVQREPLFTPSGSDPSTQSQNGTSGAIAGGSAASGKLPFNQRKVRWFDSVTASDRNAARRYLQTELSKLRNRDGATLVKHLQMMQRRERRLLETGKESVDTLSDEEEEDAVQALEMTAVGLGITSLPDNMTSSLSAALVLEGLSLNPLESVEGMSKCYDAIVAAGAALLDAELDGSRAAGGNVTTPTAAAASLSSSRKKPSKSEIMAALAPVLITTLEQPSGETILALANLRRMCGTKRYQRRFVQRVAPSLIRPPSAAMWCLRHQSDMEAILAAAEMLFDMAHEIFSTGWHERGRQILADSVRADALRAAAEQLKSLSSPQSGDSSLITGLSGARLQGRGGALKKGATPIKEGVEPLAEWEVLAVDIEIRNSINNIFSRDWSRQIVTSPSVPRDDASVGSYRHRRGISSGKPKPIEGERPAEISSTSLVPSAPSAILQPPPSPVAALSPRAHHKAPIPLSPASQMPPASSSQMGQANPEYFGGPSVGPPPSGATESNVTAPVSPSSRKTPKKVVNDVSDSRTPPHTPTPTQQMIGTPPRSPTNDPNRLKAIEQPGFDGTLVAAPQLPSMTAADAASAPLTPSRMPQTHAIVHSPAPLSPMSVGNASYSSMDSAHRAASGASVSAAGNQTAQQSAQTAYLRTLTSTAAERKRTVAACRALRAQISRFEEAFVQLHGRPPKTASERAPLATTYAQYREWKRAIRADAACRIQALFRGARVRWMLLRSSNPRMSRVVMTRAGRPDFAANGHRGAEPVGSNAVVKAGRSSQNHVLNKISIPVEIGGDKAESLATPILTQKPSGSSPRAGSLMPSGETEISNSDEANSPGQPAAPALSPNWSGNPPNMSVAERMARRDESSSSAGSMYSSSTPTGPSPSGRVPISNLTFGGVHINDLPVQDLNARKRELKQQLKQYDMNFAKIHGRMPVKAEKEPIRHLYESYNALKARITYLEREGTVVSGPPMPYRRSSADRASLSNASTGSVGSAASDASSGDEGLADIHEPQRTSARASLSSEPSTPAGAPSQDLAALKAEKGQLHQMLRSYEKDFFKLHNRQVSSFADIRPVASQYRRYKEIKKAIAAAQQGGGKK